MTPEHKKALEVLIDTQSRVYPHKYPLAETVFARIVASANRF